VTRHAQSLPARRARRRDLRPLAIVATLLGVVVAGMLLSMRDAPQRASTSAQVRIDAAVDPGLHARQRRNEEIDARFQQAVLMLHARQYAHAATALHRVLELAPEMPEAHVNLGFAMLGLERHAEARDFFSSAMALRPRQTNAYWGLAVALEELDDLEGALGAMRSFVHLSPPDAPFMRKAQAAIWEWEARLKEDD